MINSIDLYPTLSSQSSCLSQVFSHSRNIINLKHKMTSKRHQIWVSLSFLSMTVSCYFWFLNQLCGQCCTFILKRPAFSWQTACFYCVGGGAHRQTDSEGERERETVSVTVWPLTAIYASPTWKWSSQMQSTLLQGNISTTDITTQGKAFSFTCLNSDLIWFKLGDFSLTFKNSFLRVSWIYLHFLTETLCQ